MDRIPNMQKDKPKQSKTNDDKETFFNKTIMEQQRKVSQSFCFQTIPIDEAAPRGQASQLECHDVPRPRRLRQKSYFSDGSQSRRVSWGMETKTTTTSSSEVFDSPSHESLPTKKAYGEAPCKLEELKKKRSFFSILVFWGRVLHVRSYRMCIQIFFNCLFEAQLLTVCTCMQGIFNFHLLHFWDSNCFYIQAIFNFCLFLRPSYCKCIHVYKSFSVFEREQKTFHMLSLEQWGDFHRATSRNNAPLFGDLSQCYFYRYIKRNVSKMTINFYWIFWEAMKL